MLTPLKDFTETQLAICEDKKESGCMKVRGIFQKADTRNANGRIYPGDLWERVLHDGRVTSMIESRRMLGEVEHPGEGVTNLSRVSHIITNLRRDGNDIIGEAEIVNTPSGLIIQELIRRGVPVGISSRGKGSSVTKNGVEYVEAASFVLDTFDFVYRPSTPGAYPELQESVLAGSPYAKDTPMTAKIDQIKKFDGRAGEITTAIAGKLAINDLLKLHRECVEIVGSLDTLVGSLTEAETKEHGDYAKQVSERLATTSQAVTAKLDKAYQGSDLSRRVETVLSQKVEKDSSVDLYKTLLDEARQENEYLRTRLDELSSLAESSDSDILRRYNAAASLCQETMDKLQETTTALAELSAEHDSLRQRYDAAVELVAGVQETQAAGRMAYLVREAIEEHPELGKFVKILRSCETEDELAERVTELVDGLGLDATKTESDLTSRLNFSAALNDSDSTDGNEVISESALPKKGATTKKPEPKRATAEKILEESVESTPEGDLTDELLRSMGLQ